MIFPRISRFTRKFREFFFNLVDLGVADVALALHTLGGDQTLDLGGLGGLALAFTANDVLGDVVVLGESEQLTDLGGALGAQTTGGSLIGESGNLSVTLFYFYTNLKFKTFETTSNLRVFPSK